MNSQIRKLLWVAPGNPEISLDSATWLDTSRELNRSGWDVMLIVVGDGKPKLLAGVQLYSILRPEIYLLRQVIFHARALSYIFRRLNSTDVVLFHSMSAPWMLALAILLRLRNRRLPALIMDTRTVDMAPASRGRWKDSVRRNFHAFIEKSVNRWVDGRLAITPRMADYVKIPREKLWGVWPSGVDAELFKPAQLSRTWPGRGEPVQLVYVGVLNYERNLMNLSAAVVRANAEGMPIVFSLIGDGNQKDELEIFAGTTNGCVRVLPRVDHAEIPAVLSRAHIGVLPFPDEEKFQVSSPIKLFEYMASGLPILATRIACHTDVIGEGDYVIWIEGSGEEELLVALRQVWKKTGELREMGGRAAIASKAWTWSESAHKLKTALETGLANLSNQKA
jgi:glycosyltransferase involved in cell wall biosynthesis